MKVLFITRKYPPKIGGMEKYSKELIDNINVNKRVIALKRSQWHLFWFVPYSIIRGFLYSKDCDLIYLCDSFLALAGLILKWITKKPVLITAHGLDITYRNPLYQFFIVRQLKRLDRIICVSSSTLEECVKKGVKRKKCFYIPNGVNINIGSDVNSILMANNGERIKLMYKKRLSKFTNFQMKNKDVIVTVGRLTKRKGVAWFVKNVMPKLDESIVYLVIGSGADESRIKSRIKKYKLEKRVFMLGQVSDEDLKNVCLGADVFVMPNIKIIGDMEGFGIVALEAGCLGLPVISANLEGIKDAVKHGKNGVLVSSMDANGFVKAINRFLNDPEKKRLFAIQAMEYNRKYYRWERIAGMYKSCFDRILDH